MTKKLTIISRCIKILLVFYVILWAIVAIDQPQYWFCPIIALIAAIQGFRFKF